MKSTRFMLPLLAASLVSSASAATVLVDFGSAGGSTSGADTNGNFWTTINAAGTTSNLLDTTNTASGINLTLAFSGIGVGVGGSAFNNSDVTAPGSFNQAFAFGDGLFANDGGLNFATISLSGLATNTDYSISLYGGRNTSWSTGSALIGVTDGSGTGGTYGNRSLFTFTITSTATGTAAFTFREQGGTGTADSVTLNDLSITPVPEPSVALLGGLGVLGLLRRRRSA